MNGENPRRERLHRVVRLVVGCTFSACLLGLAVDLITANLAVEYFSVHHPKVMQTESPWLLASYWGIGASWWAGGIAGSLLAWLNERRVVPWSAGQILDWVERSCLGIWGSMMLIVLGTYLSAELVPVSVRPVTFESDRRLMAVAMAHQYEYWIAGIALIFLAWKVRNHPPRR